MFESINPIVIIVVIITLVILFNIAMIFRYRNPTPSNENKAVKSMLNTIKSPWRNEDEALNELARLIKDFEDDPQKEE